MLERIPRAALVAVLAALWVAVAGSAGSSASPNAVNDGFVRPATVAGPGLRLVLTPAGARVLLRVSTPPIRGVSRVEISVDGRPVTAMRPPRGTFAGARGWLRLPPGPRRHLVRVAVLRGTTGRVSASRLLASHTVALPTASKKRGPDTTGPALTITAPAAGATVSGAVRVAATATDPSGVARVEFRVDGTLVGSDATAPYGDAVTWDSLAVADGAHQLAARAVDGRGNATNATVSVTVTNAVAPAPPPASGPIGPSRLYWGAWVDGDRWGYSDAPWDARTMDRFEAEAGGKRMSIVHWGQYWYRGGVGQPFYPTDFEKVRTRGAIPLIDWNSWDAAAGGSTDQPSLQLRDIASGAHDAYIRSWATAAAAYGKPFFLRFDHEMNGTWYPWSEARNGNSPGDYVAAWRHVHDIFVSVGARNVTWVWAPNTIYPGSIPLGGLYPGDAYVDWAGMDGYNWGTNPAKPAGWKAFRDTFRPTYDALGTLAPAKPVMVAETASSEYGGSKAAWIADALATMPTEFPRIHALVWFDWNADGMDWVIESSASAQSAFATGIASAQYMGSAYANLPAGPIATP